MYKQHTNGMQSLYDQNIWVTIETEEVDAVLLSEFLLKHMQQ